MRMNTVAMMFLKGAPCPYGCEHVVMEEKCDDCAATVWAGDKGVSWEEAADAIRAHRLDPAVYPDFGKSVPA